MLTGARRVVGDPSKAPLLELLLDEVESLMDELVARASVTNTGLWGGQEQAQLDQRSRAESAGVLLYLDTR